jgi:hypothetical protein
MLRGTIAAVILAATTAAFAAKSPAPAPPTATETLAIQTATLADADSRQTRDDLRSLLHRYPPQVARVLKIDPILLSNASYLANYPALATFAAQHPEVLHNPDFFLDSVQIPMESDGDQGGYRMWRELLGDVGGFAIFLVFISVLVWTIKTLIEQRRWSRLSRIQTEVHSKLLDRFTSNEELLAYIQTPAGKRFLESAPIPLEMGPRPISAPVGRIFWSLQAGLVAIGVGIGFDLVSLRVTSRASEGLYGIGVISLLVGIALVISAVVFYALSRRFGLWEPAASAVSDRDESVS